MKIKLYRFSIPFKKYLIINNVRFNYREGVVVSVTYMGQTGFGEASPLESFNRETLSDAVWALEGLIAAIDDCSVMRARELAKEHLVSVPSAAFAFDTALYDLEARLNKKPLRYFINPKALQFINVNTLIDKDSSLSNKSLKIKLSERNIFSLIDRIETLCSRIEPGSKVRLDFNGSLDLPRSIRLVKSIEHLKEKIEYIEQPLCNDESCLEDTAELRLHSEIPIALDESASSLESIEKIINFSAADAIILKPMQCGFYSDIFKIKNILDDSEIKIIFSSMYDGPIAFHASLNMAASLKVDSYCGYDTTKLYKIENLFLVEINSGRIELIPDHGIGISLNDIKEHLLDG